MKTSAFSVYQAYIAKPAAVLLALLATTGKALACSICVNKLACAILPPFWLWLSLAVSWFLASGLVRSRTGCVLPGQPTFKKALLLVLVLWLLGAALVGFPILLFLFLPPLIAFVRIVRASPTLSLSDKATRALRLIGYVHVAGIAVASILLVSTYLTRSPNTSLQATPRTIR